MVFNTVGLWDGAEHDATNIAWAKKCCDAFEPFSTGTTYVNFLSEEGPDRVRAAYGPQYVRLSRIKTKYDPDNFFRINQNIEPEPAPGQQRAV